MGFFETLLRFLQEAGPLIWPIILLTLVILLLVLWNVLCMLASWGHPSVRRRSIDGVLFWGGIAAILGFLGQWMGIHKMTVYVAEHGIANPQLIAYGISESLLTPVAGMFVLMTSALIWFLLRVGLWRVESRG